TSVVMSASLAGGSIACSDDGSSTSSTSSSSAPQSGDDANAGSSRSHGGPTIKCSPDTQLTQKHPPATPPCNGSSIAPNPAWRDRFCTVGQLIEESDTDRHGMIARMAISGPALYWTDGGGELRRIPKSGGNVERVDTMPGGVVLASDGSSLFVIANK